MSIEISNEELLSPRDLSREYGRQIRRLQHHEIDKLVLMKGGKMEAIIIRPDEYEELMRSRRRRG